MREWIERIKEQVKNEMSKEVSSLEDILVKVENIANTFEFQFNSAVESINEQEQILDGVIDKVRKDVETKFEDAGSKLIHCLNRLGDLMEFLTWSRKFMNDAGNFYQGLYQEMMRTKLQGQGEKVTDKRLLNEWNKNEEVFKFNLIYNEYQVAIGKVAHLIDVASREIEITQAIMGFRWKINKYDVVVKENKPVKNSEPEWEVEF